MLGETVPSFAPILAADSEPPPQVLILGSMPSVASLDQQQYYANPRNAFWWLMSELLNLSKGLTYAERAQQLVSARVAVWDVLHDCERPGSLDSNIVRDSEQPNDIVGLVTRVPSIQCIAFNGGAARKIFKRHCETQLLAHNMAASRSIDLVQLPSTSPAHASLTKQAKLTIWRDSLSDVLNGV